MLSRTNLIQRLRIFAQPVHPTRRFSSPGPLLKSLLMAPRRSARGSLPNGNGMMIPSGPPAVPAPPITASSPQTSMLHALNHIPPQPPGVPLPHPTENGVSGEEDLTPPPEEAPALPIKLVIPPVNGKGRKGKGKAGPTLAAVANGGVDDDLTPPPPESIGSAPRTQQSANGKRRAKRISYAEDPVMGGEEEEETEPTRPTRKSKKAKREDSEGVDPEDLDDEKPEVPTISTPKKKGRKKKSDVDGEEGTPAKAKKPTPKKSRLAKDEPEYDEDGNEIVKKKRKPKVYPKIEYEIPDVEKKSTTFKGGFSYCWCCGRAIAETRKGRLGYACLNTVLRGTKPDSIFCSRTCRIASIEEEGMDLPKGLALMNVRDLKTMIEVGCVVFPSDPRSR